MTVSELGQAIRFRREFFRLRQEDLSEMSGVTIKTIHLVETGTGNPSVGTLARLAEVLGMELSLKVKQAT